MPVIIDDVTQDPTILQGVALGSTLRGYASTAVRVYGQYVGGVVMTFSEPQQLTVNHLRDFQMAAGNIGELLEAHLKVLPNSGSNAMVYLEVVEQQLIILEVAAFNTGSIVLTILGSEAIMSALLRGIFEYQELERLQTALLIRVLPTSGFSLPFQVRGTSVTCLCTAAGSSVKVNRGALRLFFSL